MEIGQKLANVMNSRLQQGDNIDKSEYLKILKNLELMINLEQSEVNKEINETKFK